MKALPIRKVPGEKAQKYLELSDTYEPAASRDQVPVVWDHAEGVWITDVDGNRYLDFTSGVLVTNLGHTHPVLVEAIREQAGRLMNCYSFPTPERVSLAQRLVESLPTNLDRVFLLSPGSEATEAAMRLPTPYHGNHAILALHGA